MSRALRHIDPNESVRHLFAWTLRQTRVQAGFSLQGFAKRLGKSDSYLSAVELAEVRCTREFAEMCDRLLGIGGRLVGLWVHADAEWSQLTGKRPAGSRSGPELPPEQPNQEVRIMPVAAGEDMGADAMVMWCVDGKVYAMPTRRELLRLLGAGAVVGTVGSTVDRFLSMQLDTPGHRFAERTWITALGQESEQFGRRIEATGVGSMTPERLGQEVERLAEEFLTRPAASVLAETADLRSEVFGLLEGHHYPDQAEDLYAIAAKLCGLLAISSSDRFGCYDAAAQHARTARLCADKARQNELKAWVLGVRSTIDFWLGHYGQAADRAAEGRQYVSRGTELVRLASLEARARSRLGDRDGVQEAIDLAASARDTVDEEDEARHIGIFAFPVANQVRCAGNAHMWLGLPPSIETAHHELTEALRLFEAEPQQSYAHTSVARVDLAIVELRLKNLDAAAATMQPVLALSANRRLEGVVRRSGDLRKQLASPEYRHAALARELGQAVEGFCASSVTRQLARPSVR